VLLLLFFLQNKYYDTYRKKYAKAALGHLKLSQFAEMPTRDHGRYREPAEESGKPQCIPGDPSIPRPRSNHKTVFSAISA
jgi:hypothetical protein